MKAVIPAAGLGTRLLPATKAQPKEMLPVYYKPTIHYAVEEAVKSGIDDILIITGRNKRSIEDYFDKSYELEYTLQKAGKDRDLKKVRKSLTWQIYVMSDRKTLKVSAMQFHAQKDTLGRTVRSSFRRFHYTV